MTPPLFRANGPDTGGSPGGAVAAAPDVTACQRMEECLRESQRDLKHAQALAHTGSWRLNVSRNELSWSDETYRIFGVPQGMPLTYEAFLTAVHPADREEVDRAWQAALGGAPYDIEHRIVVGEEVKWVREQAILEFAADGGLLAGFGAVQEITERKKTARLAVLRAEIGGALGQNQDLRTILQRCSELLVRYLDVAFFRIWTLNEAEGVLEMRASAGMFTHTDGPHSRVPVGMFKIGLIALEHRPHLTNDLPDDPRISDKTWARREGMVAFAGYPLIVADRVVGVMATFSRTPMDEKTFGELATVADRIAQCIERKRAEEDRERLIGELQEALCRVKTLSGLLPICAGCKKIRDDKGYWNQIEAYISEHSNALFTHGYCPDCALKALEEIDKLKRERP